MVEHGCEWSGTNRALFEPYPEKKNMQFPSEVSSEKLASMDLKCVLASMVQEQW